MHYIVYKTTNLINGKFYIGKHKTKNLDDGYIGSGSWLKRAIKKYGKENFTTIILYDFDVEWKMNLAEKILVVRDREISYNLCPGGHGGFGYINEKKLGDRTGKKHSIESRFKMTTIRSEENRLKDSIRMLGNNLNPKVHLKGEKHPASGPKSKEHKEKISKSISLLPRNNIQCPHCMKMGDSVIMKRWHFEKCKLRV